MDNVTNDEEFGEFDMTEAEFDRLWVGSVPAHLADDTNLGLAFFEVVTPNALAAAQAIPAWTSVDVLGSSTPAFAGTFR